MAVRTATIPDASSIAEIYNHYVLNSVCTFEEEPVPVQEMENRIDEVIGRYPWLVYEHYGKVVGYSYAGKWKQRSAYKHTVEVSVYLAPGSHGQGIGKALYQRLIEELRLRGIHAVIGGIALPNDLSIKLHESLGFKKIGQFKEVGLKFNSWVDVGYWELLL